MKNVSENNTILSTTGTSIFTNGVSFVSSPENIGDFPILAQYIQEAKSEEQYKHLRIGVATMNYIESRSETIQNRNEILRELIKYVEIASGERASAEINTIEKIVKKKKIKKENILIEFIVSKTFVSELCLEVLLDYCEREGFQGAFKKIEGLGYTSLSFVRTGLKNLIHKVIDSIEQYRDDSNVIVAATGGFKAEFAYITIISTLYRVELYYIHEAFRNIVKLPPLHIKLNKEFYVKYYNFFQWLEEREKNVQETTRETIKKKFPNILDNEDLYILLELENNNYYLSPIITIFRNYYGNLNLLVLADGPNVTNIDLEELKKYAKSIDNKCILKYFSHSPPPSNDQNAEIEAQRLSDIQKLGYIVIKKPKEDKDIDDLILNEIDIELECVRRESAKIIIIASGDKDYFRKIKSTRKYNDIDFYMAIGAKKGLAGIYKLMNVEILYFPEKLKSFEDLNLNLKSWNLRPIKRLNEIFIPYENDYEKRRIEKVIEIIKLKFTNNIIRNLKFDDLSNENRFRIIYKLDQLNLDDISCYLEFMNLNSKKSASQISISYKNDHDKNRIENIFNQIKEKINEDKIANIQFINLDNKDKFQIVISELYSEKYCGTVKSFNSQKGYGFIDSEEGIQDIFVHKNFLMDSNDFEKFSEGIKVKFKIVEDQRGLQAHEVEIINKKN